MKPITAFSLFQSEARANRKIKLSYTWSRNNIIENVFLNYTDCSTITEETPGEYEY